MSSSLLTLARAHERILAAVEPLGAECVPVDDALDRVLARDLPAAGDVPPFASAAMDGYAVFAGPAGRTLRVIGESRAGLPSELAIGADEAIRTSTGAALPTGANAVIRQERVEAEGDAVRLCAEVTVADDVRYRGEDLAAGALVLARGTRLGSAELAGAVAAGASALWCARRPRVAILCTGTELRAPGEPLGPGEIHNSNAITLRALAMRCGALAAPAECLVDDGMAIEAALAYALGRADVVVVSGGVSVGPHDHVKPALDALGVHQSFWGVAVQPGKPTWFGTFQVPRDVGRQANSQGTRSVPVFGLPGNPVAAFVVFILFVAPALLALQGVNVDGAEKEMAELGARVKLNPSREQAITVRLEQKDGRTTAVPNGPQGANLISSLLGAEALAMIPAGTGELDAGSPVTLIRLPR
jgi:molybdopterin molybdotransferase